MAAENVRGGNADFRPALTRSVKQGKGTQWSLEIVLKSDVDFAPRES